MHGNNNQPVRWAIELTPDEPATAIGNLGERVEAVGLDAAFVSNHYGNRDPMITLAHLADRTETLHIGPGVLNPYEIHPVRLASQIATLDELSGGRAVFGIGAGDRSTLRTMGIDRDQPLAAVRDAIAIVRTLLAGDRSSRSGSFSPREAALNYDPDPVPLYVGAQGPQMLELSASVADGILFNGAAPIDYHTAMPAIDRGREQRAAEREGVHILGFTSLSIDRDADRARHAARKPVAYIVGGAPDDVIDRHGLDSERVAAVRSALEANDRPRAYDLVTPAMTEAFCVVGSPKTVRDRLTELTAFVDGIVAASPLGPDREAAIELLGEIVQDIPALNR